MPKKGDRSERQPLGDANDPHGWHQVTEAFFEWMAVTNYSPRTIHNRRNYLTYFIRWALERGVTRPNEVTKATLERYQRYLLHYRKRDGDPMATRGQHSRLTPVRAFFKWTTRQNLTLYNPASELDLPRLEMRLPKHILTEAEAEKVMGVPDLKDPLGVRDRAMLEVLYSTGMRRMELMNLNLHSIDEERGTVMIRQGKGAKDRMTAIGDRAIKWVRRYLDEVRPDLVREPDCGTLFLTNLFEPFTPNRLTQMVRDYIKAADIAKQGSCHLLRHTCATLMLENGADTRFIQQQLGHARLDTTQIYTQVSIRKLKEIHTATHPAKLRDSRNKSQKPEDSKNEPPEEPGDDSGA